MTISIAAEGSSPEAGAGGFVAVAPGTYSPPSAPSAPSAPSGDGGGIPSPTDPQWDIWKPVAEEEADEEMTPAEALEKLGYVPAEAPPPPGVVITPPAVEVVPTLTEHLVLTEDFKEKAEAYAPLYDPLWGKLGIDPSAGKYAPIIYEHQMRQKAGVYPYGPSPTIETAEETEKAVAMTRKVLARPYDPGMDMKEAYDYLFVSPHIFESYKGVGEGQRVKTSIGEFYAELGGRIYGGGGQGEITPVEIVVDGKSIPLSQTEYKALQELPTKDGYYDLARIAQSEELSKRFDVVRPGFSDIAPYLDIEGSIRPEIVQALPFSMLTTYGITKAWYDETKSSLRAQAKHRELESSLRPYIKSYGAPGYEVAGGYDLPKIAIEDPIPEALQIELFGAKEVQQAEVYGRIAPYMVGGAITPMALASAMSATGLTAGEIRASGIFPVAPAVSPIALISTAWWTGKGKEPDIVTLAERYGELSPPQEAFLAEYEKVYPSPYAISAIKERRRTDPFWTEDKEVRIKPLQAAYYQEAKEEYDRIYGEGEYLKAGARKLPAEFFAPARALEPTVTWGEITPLEHVIGAGQVALWTSPLWAGAAGRLATAGLRRVPGVSRLVPAPSAITVATQQVNVASRELKAAQQIASKETGPLLSSQTAARLQSAQQAYGTAQGNLTNVVRAAKGFSSHELSLINRQYPGYRSAVGNLSRAHSAVESAAVRVEAVQVGTRAHAQALNELAQAQSRLSQAAIRYGEVITPTAERTLVPTARFLPEAPTGLAAPKRFTFWEPKVTPEPFVPRGTKFAPELVTIQQAQFFAGGPGGELAWTRYRGTYPIGYGLEPATPFSGGQPLVSTRELLSGISVGGRYGFGSVEGRFLGGIVPRRGAMEEWRELLGFGRGKIVAAPIRPITGGGVSVIRPSIAGTPEMLAREVITRGGVIPITYASGQPIPTPGIFTGVVPGRVVPSPTPGVVPSPSPFITGPLPRSVPSPIVGPFVTPFISPTPSTSPISVPSPFLGLAPAPAPAPIWSPTPTPAPAPAPIPTPVPAPVPTPVLTAPFPFTPVPVPVPTAVPVPPIIRGGILPPPFPWLGTPRIGFGAGFGRGIRGITPLSIWEVAGHPVYAPHPLTGEIIGKRVGKRRIKYGAVPGRGIGIASTRIDGGRLGSSGRMFVPTTLG